MSIKNILYWLFGAISILLGVVMAMGSSDAVLGGAFDVNVTLGLIVSLLLIMFGGLLWIGVAITVREN